MALFQHHRQLYFSIGPGLCVWLQLIPAVRDGQVMLGDVHLLLQSGRLFLLGLR